MLFFREILMAFDTKEVEFDCPLTGKTATLKLTYAVHGKHKSPYEFSCSCVEDCDHAAENALPINSEGEIVAGQQPSRAIKPQDCPALSKYPKFK